MEQTTMASTKTANEFEGLTATECCDGCYENFKAAPAAQRRINEIEATYKRQLSQIQGSESVMEGDREWLDRVAEINPELRTEWAKLAAVAGGHCVISGQPYCASPAKGGLHSREKNDPAALKRFNQAKELLADAAAKLKKGATVNG
jgi:hypothetical protein